jgi:hypothetical protein
MSLLILISIQIEKLSEEKCNIALQQSIESFVSSSKFHTNFEAE